ncbi:hypothetical protein NDU88_000691 [Pleurodeles waltl]|uniref:Peptidase A2 domain-containing protein n=1 Tax=Pleurodeles waltl TaxID=8319 RepID=A0AAV7SXC5_PLEWA|nr:hypothetical protein NDU88_000691 [Pleurodeles waltl]
MSRPTAVFKVCEKDVELMIDSGSMYTIIPERVFKVHWQDVNLIPKDINLGGYQGESIDILGYMEGNIRYGSRCTTGKVYVSMEGPPILGWMHQFDLKIMLHPRAPNQVLVVDELTLERVLSGAEKVFCKKFGWLKGYVHKVKVKSNATPIQHKLRRVPLSVRDGLKKLLGEMLEDGVIEPVEASEWVSPVVITKKSDGRLRFCVDLRSVNQNIVVDVFPLPNINEFYLPL